MRQVSYMKRGKHCVLDGVSDKQASSLTIANPQLEHYALAVGKIRGDKNILTFTLLWRRLPLQSQGLRGAAWQAFEFRLCSQIFFRSSMLTTDAL